MFKNITPVAVAASLFVGAAHAATVNVDFDGGSSVNVRTVPHYYGDDPADYINVTAGVWQESGVNVHWTLHDDVTSSFGIDPASITPDYFQTLADQPPGSDPALSQSLRFERQDGGMFNLSRIGTDHTYEGLGAYVDFIPEAGSGLDPMHVLTPLLGPSLRLTGVKSDGSMVEVSATTKTLENWLGAGNEDYFGRFAGMDVYVPDSAMSALTNLTSLTLDIFQGFYPDLAAQRAELLRSLVEFGAPQSLLEHVESCGLETQCTIDGVGDFSIYVSDFHGLNYNELVRIADIDIDFVGGAGPQPAHVPLPATALLLLGGIGALGAARLTRKS